MFRLFRVLVEFPALDRLMDYLDASQQGDIDNAAERVRALTARLNAARTGLDEATKDTKNAR